MSKTKQVRVSASAEEVSVWRERGIHTPADIRASLAWAISHPEELLPASPKVDYLSWHVRFSPEELERIDSLRGEQERSRWIRDLLNRVPRSASTAAAEFLEKQLRMLLEPRP